MKRVIMLLTFAAICHAVAFGQKKYEMVIEKNDGLEVSIDVEDIERTYFRKATCPDGNHPHMIDLGLPSGTKWACCNVGANSPEDYGDYIAWGETHERTGQTSYSWGDYQYAISKDNFMNIGSDIAGTRYDAATANWGAPWRMPSLSQMRELFNSCSSTWITQNGVIGWKFFGSTGGAIFLPAAGYRYGQGTFIMGEGIYWSSTLYESSPVNAISLGFTSEKASLYLNGRFYGFSVRPVRPN